MLGSLDNEVIFKKAFRDKFVFEHFVKDILNLDVEIGTIETEKRFTPAVGNIDFKLDIFAETTDKRIVIELQRAQYDYNFDRFLHYLMMVITEQQQDSKKYGFKQTVYMIVVMTLPYIFDDKTGEPIKDEMILTKFDSRNFKGDKIPLFEHQMMILNPNHPQLDTPAQIRDWLDLVYQSIHSPNRPNINLANAGVKRAADLIEFANLTPVERREAMEYESGEVVKSLYEKKTRAETLKEVGVNLIAKGFDNALISELTGLSVEEVEKLRNQE
jgi:PD-(D/E)XK nuclease family transposase